ncbi:hypothetical protein [Pacificimonas flava]|uniref:Uncharacterized protein n=1 Tax=Pacificimonas flava TaxID=1234595 RepID=M2U7U0_9SPHN|nr:hypothetical protein [Pacificimonas flava]EMD84068.1 hypothetical protein C725_1040 [Pacificimonas flava]MBB5280959.1 hypothetical protein [Pacificimonas flava]
MAPTVDPNGRGYRILYRQGETNYCPGCGHANWYIGRHAAECAFCATVLPLGASTHKEPEYALAG